MLWGVGGVGGGSGGWGSLSFFCEPLGDFLRAEGGGGGAIGCGYAGL